MSGPSPPAPSFRRPLGQANNCRKCFFNTAENMTNVREACAFLYEMCWRGADTTGRKMFQILFWHRKKAAAESRITFSNIGCRDTFVQYLSHVGLRCQ